MTLRVKRRPPCHTGRLERLESRVLLSRVEGIDVSQWQGTIDWNQVRTSGKEFAFIRGSRTNLSIDPTFLANMAGATSAGVLVGAYHFAQPLGDGTQNIDPIADADAFVDAAGDYMMTGYLRPVLDIETGDSLTKAELSQWVNKFLDEVEKRTGVSPLIYCGTAFATSNLNQTVTDHDFWIARWNGSNSPDDVNPQTDQPATPSNYPNPYGPWNDPVGGPPSNDSWAFWQYTSNGDGRKIGVGSDRLDLDVFNGDMATLRRDFVIGTQKNFGTPGDSPFSVGPGIATTIMACDYDVGGDGVSYNDTSPKKNNGDVYRTSVREGVDLALMEGTTDQFRVTDTRPGEWVEYTIDVAADDEYQIDYRLSQTDAGATLHAEIDGNSLPQIDVPQTNSFGTFATKSQKVGLASGRHVLRLSFDGAAPDGKVADVHSVFITEAPDPPPPPPAAPPPDFGHPGVATYVRGGLFAPQNFGGESEVLVRRAKSSSNTQWAYLKFDLNDVASFTSVKLRLTGRLSDNAVASLKTNVYSAAATKIPWDQHLLTWKNKPGVRKLRGTIALSGTTDAAYELDLTTFLQAEFAAGRKVVTLVLRNVNVSDTQSVFGSDESLAPPGLMLA
jgi:GH25 family lysozyme M1 (1,4-beta-N-acetylmuramidase)